MSWTRIKAILLQEWYVLYRSGEVITDIVVFPVGHIVVFGFISLFLSQENKELGELVLLGMILWQVVWIVEYALTLGSLWNIWSRNLTNLFISPLRLSEYIFAHTMSENPQCCLPRRSCCKTERSAEALPKMFQSTESIR
jgi:ABC-2 type transport system permease protein